MLYQGGAMSISTHSRALSEALFLSCLLFFSLSAKSELITQRQNSGVVATAQLLEGEADKQAVLILHGFLQTHDFFTVRRLADALHDMGHTVLLPNLTLGIDNRRQSLACEAIHTHTMEQDIEEIDFWTNWLYRHNRNKVTLVGHSAGSLQLLAYLAEEPDPLVDQAILISLIAFAQGPIAKEDETERQRALEQLAQGEERISHYRLAYCDSYATTPANYLSYLAWNGNKTLENLNNLAVVPTIILGGEDQRLGENWLPSLKGAGAAVIEVPGANHFFDHEYEFDLMDCILELLER
jgi:pimeloyl-ACP methyl ester carboxylesterase